MKKIFLLILFYLSLAACGEENASSNLPGFPRDILTKGDGVTSNPSGTTTTPPPDTSSTDKGNSPSPKVPGYICNSEGICISEKRAKALTPHRDALGYFTNIVGRPYDPCKEDGNCKPDDDDQGSDDKE